MHGKMARDATKRRNWMSCGSDVGRLRGRGEEDDVGGDVERCGGVRWDEEQLLLKRARVTSS